LLSGKTDKNRWNGVDSLIFSEAFFIPSNVKKQHKIVLESSDNNILSALVDNNMILSIVVYSIFDFLVPRKILLLLYSLQQTIKVF
jgi:hypothetical protein